MSTKKSEITLYHNPRCSKSRSALSLLQGKGIEPQVIEYLKAPPTRAELALLVRKLGVKPEAIVRTGEDIYKEKYKGRPMTDAQWLDALAANPILLERPIAVKGDQAVVGRPPENVLKLA